jgi:adenylylsulfate kinase-like enzyme
MMRREPMPLVISGPIASGKSTVARALAKELERRGCSAATIDLDLVYEMLEHDARKDDDAKWLAARQAAAALTDSFLAHGTEIVIVDGEFLTSENREAYLRCLRTDVTPCFVTLSVSVDEAVRRAQGDSTRTLSRDRGFLHRHYAAIEAALQATPSTDLVLDTERLSADDLAGAIAGWLHRRDPTKRTSGSPAS